MKDKLLQIRVDKEFCEKLAYLKNINGYKTESETVRKIIEKETRRYILPNTFDKAKKTFEHSADSAKKGKWLQIESWLGVSYRCSCCNGSYTEQEAYALAMLGETKPKYCPNCGADLGEK